MRSFAQLARNWLGAWGEEVIVPIDPSAGREQEYVEDCPECCAPVLLQVRVGSEGEITVAARSELSRVVIREARIEVRSDGRGYGAMAGG